VKARPGRGPGLALTRIFEASWYSDFETWEEWFAARRQKLA